jgi:hypothetical protein
MQNFEVRFFLMRVMPVVSTKTPSHGTWIINDSGNLKKEQSIIPSIWNM